MERDVIYYLDNLILAVDLLLNDLKLKLVKEDKKKMFKIKEIAEETKKYYIKNKALVGIGDDRMKLLFNYCDVIFDKFLIDEIDYNKDCIKSIYESMLHKKYVDDLRKKGRKNN